MGIHVAEAVDGEDGISEYTIFKPGLGRSSRRVRSVTWKRQLIMTIGICSVARHQHASKKWFRGCDRHPSL